MKQIVIMLVAVLFIFSACKNNNKDDMQTNRVMLTDTTSIYSHTASSDTGSALKRGERVHDVAKSQHSNETATASSDKSTTTSPDNSNGETAQKKGWSNRAKGALIGGATGAVGGAIISKHKGKGAIIGGLAGAAGGYIIGNEKDKKKNKGK
jgi:cytochrome c556